jgi:predicted patatin/cPLA2 family phospholipase
MRGLYTAGVLELLMEKNIYIPYVIGVSAGACNGSSYISRQKDRNKLPIEYINHPNYMSLRNIVRKRQLFDMDFIFDELPKNLVPFDFQTFQQAKEKYIVGTTDIVTGEPVYYSKEEYFEQMLLLIRASSSLPFFSPVIDFEGRKLLDGGIVDPIPIKKSEEDGNKYNIVILTRDKTYRKNKAKMQWLFKYKYRDYPGIVEVIAKRHHIYNKTLDYLYEQEKLGKVFIFQPDELNNISSLERKSERLQALYDFGYKDAQTKYEKLEKWLKEIEYRGEENGENSKIRTERAN